MTHRLLLPLLSALTLVAACSSDTKESPRAPKLADENEETKKTAKETDDEPTKTETTTTTTPETPPATPPAMTFPRPAAAGECALGDGVYCSGNGVEAAAGTLYRCTAGTVSEEKKCATACLYMKQGLSDACDGDTAKCPRGSGLYCGGNYLSADPKTLYRCTDGAITVEQACATNCVKEADGTPDRCE